MYIFELIAKLRNKKQDDAVQKRPVQPELADMAGENYEDVCKHILVPIDSTKKVLACSKCGFLIRSENLPRRKKSNPYNP